MEDLSLLVYVWAVTATIAAAWYMQAASRYHARYEAVGDLLCDLALGKATATNDGDGHWTVESDKHRLSFRRVRKEVMERLTSIIFLLGEIMSNKIRYYRNLDYSAEGVDELEKEIGCKVLETAEMYQTGEADDMPSWVELEFYDASVLSMKMALGILNASNFLHSVSLHPYLFEMSCEPNWGGWSVPRLAIYQNQGIWLKFYPKHSMDEIELDVTKQFYEAIGE